jgi:hypothetical protein
MSQNYKNDITVRELHKWHYCREIKNITLLSEKHKNGITVCKINKNYISVPELQKWHYCPRDTKMT